MILQHSSKLAKIQNIIAKNQCKVAQNINQQSNKNSINSNTIKQQQYSQKYIYKNNDIPQYCFSSDQQKQNTKQASSSTNFEKVTYKQHGSQHVLDYKNMSYEPQNKLEFDSTGRCLLYLYRPRFYTYTMMYAKYIVPFVYVAKLIPNNPFYLNYPVALPFMFLFEAWAIMRMIKLKSYLRKVISEVYLHKDGQTIEIIYQHQLWKKLKDMQTSELLFIPSMKSPQVNDQMKPLKGDIFPEEYPFQDIKGHGYAWMKYYRNPQNYFVIPKYANYIDTETLIAVFAGKLIDINKTNYVEVDYIKSEKYLEI